jgi:hypothetical protein
MQFTAQEQRELEGLASQSTRLYARGFWPYPDLGKASLVAWLRWMCNTTIAEHISAKARSEIEASRDACLTLAEKLERMTEPEVTELYAALGAAED